MYYPCTETKSIFVLPAKVQTNGNQFCIPKLQSSDIIIHFKEFIKCFILELYYSVIKSLPNFQELKF